MLLSLCGVRGKTKNAKLACRTETLHMACMCLAVAYEHQAHADVLHRDEGGFQRDRQADRASGNLVSPSRRGQRSATPADGIRLSSNLRLTTLIWASEGFVSAIRTRGNGAGFGRLGGP
jgi:hypothetical protein